MPQNKVFTNNDQNYKGFQNPVFKNSVVKKYRKQKRKTNGIYMYHNIY